MIVETGEQNTKEVGFFFTLACGFSVHKQRQQQRRVVRFSHAGAQNQPAAQLNS
jgi:hypothetical protein